VDNDISMTHLFVYASVYRGTCTLCSDSYQESEMTNVTTRRKAYLFFKRGQPGFPVA